MENLDIESAKKGMDKMFYFAMNIPYDNISYQFPWEEKVRLEILPEFVRDIDWGCDMSHIIEKWKTSLNEYGYYGAVFNFYENLDSKNREKFLEYILKI